ncbi:hypothetical protein ACGF0J_16570 [Nonomuraea sp. NPDC047897]|uniref:hypothetical protein n=1 Tax=Nonomuraea sp. NPDC047897 TaxID=3364346 RepID=UPI003722D23D
MTSNRPRPGTGRETSSRDTSPRRSPVAGDRRPASPGQRSGGTAGAAGAGEGRPAPRASSRGPRPGLLHQWCEDNFTTAPLLARACHLYVTP